MKQKHLFMKGMLAFALVFAFALVACGPGDTNIIVQWEDDGSGGVQKIQIVPIPEPKLTVEKITIDGVGDIGFRLIWPPVIDAASYELWRSDGGSREVKVQSDDIYGDHIAGIVTKDDWYGNDFGYYRAIDIVKYYDAEDGTKTPTLKAGTTYTYTLKAIPIMGKVRDTNEDKWSGSANIVPEGTQLAAPSFGVAIDGWERKLTATFDGITEGLVVPGMKVEWEWKKVGAGSPLGTADQSFDSSGGPKAISDKADKTFNPYASADWKAFGGDYVATGKSTMIDKDKYGYFLDSDPVTSDPATYKHLFKKGATQDWDDLIIMITSPAAIAAIPGTGIIVDSSGEGAVNLYTFLDVSNELGLYNEGITYTMERSDKYDNKEQSKWNNVRLARAVKDGGVLAQLVKPEEFVPNMWGAFLFGASADQQLLDDQIPLALDKPAYRLKAVAADGSVDWIGHAAEWAAETDATKIPYKILKPKTVGMNIITPIDASLDVTSDTSLGTVTYGIQPTWAAPFKNLLDDGAEIHFYWKVGGYDMDSPELMAKYTKDPIVFDKTMIEANKVEYFTIPLYNLKRGGSFTVQSSPGSLSVGSGGTVPTDLKNKDSFNWGAPIYVDETLNTTTKEITYGTTLVDGKYALVITAYMVEKGEQTQLEITTKDAAGLDDVSGTATIKQYIVGSFSPSALQTALIP